MKCFTAPRRRLITSPAISIHASDTLFFSTALARVLTAHPINGLQLQAALVPGVIIPCSFMRLSNLLLVDLLAVLAGLCLMYLVCLFNCVVGSSFPHPQPLSCLRLFEHMSTSASPSPLSSSSHSADGSLDLQNLIPSPDPHAQPPLPSVLDGNRPHNPVTPSDPSRATFANTLKLGLGSASSGQQSVSQPKFGHDHGVSASPGVVLRGESSTPQNPTLSSGSSVQPQVPTVSIAELSACCLLGKVWGEAIPLASIIHRTRSEWKFTKGQIDYVDVGNDWVLIHFATSQDRTSVFNQRPWYVNGLNFVLLPWLPFFDPYHTPISRVD